MSRAIFNSWANLFVFLRPVENISYHKIVHVILLHPLRFLVNIVTLIIVCQITWTEGPSINSGKLLHYLSNSMGMGYEVDT